MDEARKAAERWEPPTLNEDPALQGFARRCYQQGYEAAREEAKPDAEMRPSEREAFIQLGLMVRDAARKARDSRLQSDDDELDRLIAGFNAPIEHYVEAVARMAGPTRRTAVANPNGLMGAFYP
jgi:hypothetical protein